MSERQNPDTALDPRCKPGPSARNSLDPNEGRFSKDYWADQQRLQISDLHFDKFPTPATFACWKTRFKTEVCTCLQFPTEAMHGIKEVEMVESVDDLKSLSSIKGTHGPDFEWLDARIASALNIIIQNTHFKKKVSLEERKAHKEDRFLRGRQIAYLIYEYFRVTGANDSVENYADLCTVVLRNDDIQEFDSKWDEILLPMTQIPSDDILESLYKLRIRVSEKLKTVLELYNMEIHQKKAGPDYHRLKTMAKRSIEQVLRNKNFGARNGNYERNAVVKISVTAKSKPMMNLVSRCSVRDPDVLASIASESPGETKSESQKVPVSSLTEQQTRTGRLVMGVGSSNSSEWNIDDKWSSQEWKSGEMLKTSTGRPVGGQHSTQNADKFVIDDDMDSDTVTESDLSFRSRSFLNRMNDRLRKILDHSSKDAMQDFDTSSMIWGIFMSSTLEASVHSINNRGKDLTLKQMFDISEKLIIEQSDEIFGVSQINWEDSLWKQLSLVNDEEVISLPHAKVYVFSDSVLCLGKVNQNPASNTVWEEQLDWFKEFITIQNFGHN